MRQLRHAYLCPERRQISGVRITVPAFLPLDAETVVRAIEVERQDEEDPVKRHMCAQVGGVVGFWQADVERVGVPHPWGIAVFDKTVSYLWRRD